MMNRVSDYCGFAVCCLGIGYLALLPFAGVAPAFGLCRGAQSQQFLCNLPRLLELPATLHLLGIACAGAVAVRLAWRPIARWRRERSHRAVMLAARSRATAAQAPANRLLAALPRVKPRSQFGLRGGPPRM